jgi:hypothetical protein
MLRSNERFAVASVDGDTTRIVPQADCISCWPPSQGIPPL